MMPVISCATLLTAAALVSSQHASAVSHDVKRAAFKVVASLSGDRLCTADNQMETEWLPRNGAIRCGVTCFAGNCVAYNFNEQNGKCDKYGHVPSNYFTVPGCTGYIAKGK